MHSTDKTTFADTDAGFYMDGTGDLHVGNATNYIKFDVSAGTIALKASTIQLGSSNVSTFDGAYGSLSGAPTLFDEAYASLSGLPTLLNTITLPDGTTATVSGSNVTITRSGLNIDSSYLNGQGAAVFGSTSLSGGRIRLLSTGAMSFTTTSSATTLDGGGIDINAHTQQIIISDSS